MGRVLWRGLYVAVPVGLTAALAMIFGYAPREATMGEVQRIFYVHVASAWIAFLAFFAVFTAGIGTLLSGRDAWDDFALAAAEIGVVYSTVVLVTGPLWAKPVWGIWWTWDARLTSMFVLWLTYVAYLALRASIEDPAARSRVAAVVGIFGFLNVPLTYFSVRWWRTQHPKPVVMGAEGSGLDPAMGWTLAVTWLALFLLAALLMGERIRLARLLHRLEEAP